MTQEEKARAYDEALEKAGALIAGETNTSDALFYLNDIINLFPELAETEDERTRQQILNYFVAQKVNEPQPVLDSWIAWLEKQGMPNWSDDDEERLQSCISTLQGKGLMGGVDTINTKWLKSLKQRLEGLQ